MFHIIILIIMMLLGLVRPQPLPGSEGILIDFAQNQSSLAGSGGRNSPAPSQSIAPSQSEPTSRPVSVPSTTQPKLETSKVEQKTPVPAMAKQELMTQDFEKTAALESAKKQKETEQRLKEEAELKQKEQIEKERLEKLAREKEEAERLAKEEADKRAKEAEQKRIADINARAANAFGQSGNGQDTGSGQSDSGQSFPASGQGAGSQSGQSGGSSTSGNGNSNGPSFSLAGRNAVNLPIPEFPGNEGGIVVVAITVDSNGKVTHAEAGVKGTNTYNTNLLKAAREAALKSLFNANLDAPVQKGTITYRFVLN